MIMVAWVCGLSVQCFLDPGLAKQILYLYNIKFVFAVLTIEFWTVTVA